MIRIVLNFIIGFVLIIGGLSGRLVYRGTHNSLLVVGIGIILIIYGIVLIVRQREEEFEKEITAASNSAVSEIKTDVAQAPSNTATSSISLDAATRETIKGMFMEEAYRFVSDKYEVSIKEAKKIVKEIKSSGN